MSAAAPSDGPSAPPREARGFSAEVVGTQARHGEVLAQAVLSSMTWDRGARALGSSP
jgi:hypothetical protein